jgi:hypothetical protein
MYLFPHGFLQHRVWTLGLGSLGDKAGGLTCRMLYEEHSFTKSIPKSFTKIVF